MIFREIGLRMLNKLVKKNIYNSSYGFEKSCFGLHCVFRCLHNYRNIIPWTNSVEFAEYLKSSVIYNSNGLLVLNKPFGITFSREGLKCGHTNEKQPSPEDLVFKKQEKNQVKKRDRPYITSGIANDSLSLHDALPYLEKHFGFDKLYICRVPSKYVSGVAVLTTSEKLVKKVRNTRLCSPSGKDNYIAVVAGQPRYDNCKIKLGLKVEEDPKKGKRVVLLHKWSNNSFKRGEVCSGVFHHQSICTGYDNLTSLVEIRVDQRRHNACRVFAADYLLSPVLGDNMYGGRVQTVMGVPVSINHFADVANAPQKLPREVYDMLDLSLGEASLIPIHVHLQEMLLPRFLPGGKDVVLKALPPPHFLWTCERLGLKEPEQAKIAAV